MDVATSSARGGPSPPSPWLAAQHRPMNLLAPIDWEPAVRRRSGRVERGYVQTWLRAGDPIGEMTGIGASAGPDPDLESEDEAERRRPKSASARPAVVIPTRRLVDRDVDAFRDVAPDWALWSWGTFAPLVTHGAAFGVTGKDGKLASVAWIFEEGRDRDKIGVATLPRYQRLGLGFATASALLAHITDERKRIPLWTASTQNLASQMLARSLGFVVQFTETVLRWVPR